MQRQTFFHVSLNRKWKRIKDRNEELMDNILSSNSDFYLFFYFSYPQKKLSQFNDKNYKRGKKNLVRSSFLLNPFFFLNFIINKLDLPRRVSASLSPEKSTTRKVSGTAAERWYYNLVIIFCFIFFFAVEFVNKFVKFRKIMGFLTDFKMK